MNQQGFTLLIGILVSSVLLIIGLSIFSLSTKQLELTTTARDSQYALYNADSGVECALYWDLKGNSGKSFTPGSAVSSVTCNGGSQIITTGTSANGGTQYIFSLPLTKGCAQATITKTGTAPNYSTTIDSLGYNSCGNANDPTRVERKLEITY